MPTIVDFPTIVKHAQEIFGAVFANDPARRHVADYLTGLMGAERTTIRGINRACAGTTDQSCLTRWLTETAWEVQALHARRLAWVQRAPKTRSSPRGVIAIDNTLVDHRGKLIEAAGWCWDQANARHVMAHDALIANSVCPSGVHYPIAGRRGKKQDGYTAETFQEHTTLCLELIDDALARGIPGDFTCDRSFTHAKVLNHLHEQRRSDGGDLKRNRKGVLDGREQKRPAVARQIPVKAKKAGRVGKRRYWYFSKRMRLPTGDHPVRIVLFWRERNDTEARKALVRNRLPWEGMRMLVVYRHRWTGPETLHRDGKQPWGLGDSPVRSGEGQTRHGSLVSAADRVRRPSMPQRRPHQWARRTLTTIGEACRAVRGALLAHLVDGMIDKLSDDHWSIPQLKAVLAQT